MIASDKDKARFWAKVEKSDKCWTWTAYKDRNGYGMFHLKGRTEYAHLVALHIVGRDRPEGMFCDHLCRNPACVNPDHLEVVTPRENILRGEARARWTARYEAKTHCKHGHAYYPDNVTINPKNRAKVCLICKSASYKRWYDRGGAKTRSRCRSKGGGSVPPVDG